MQSTTLFPIEGWGDLYLWIIPGTACRSPTQKQLPFSQNPLKDEAPQPPLQGGAGLASMGLLSTPPWLYNNIEAYPASNLPLRTT